MSVSQVRKLKENLSDVVSFVLLHIVIVPPVLMCTSCLTLL